MEHQEITVPPDPFSVTEETILLYLYEHPGGSIGTSKLVKILMPKQNTTEQQRQAFKDIQYGIETLIKDGFVEGKRIRRAETVQFAQLRLTEKGEKQAIRQKRRLKTVILCSDAKQHSVRPPLVPDFGQDDTEK